MSQLIDLIKQEVGNLSTSYNFAQGTEPEKNVIANDLAEPIAFLLHPLLWNAEYKLTNVSKNAYTVTIEFINHVKTERHTDELLAIIDDNRTIAYELLKRLSELKQNGTLIFLATPPNSPFTNLSFIEVYHKYDTNWAGVQMTVTMELYESLNVCLP